MRPLDNPRHPQPIYDITLSGASALERIQSGQSVELSNLVDGMKRLHHTFHEHVRFAQCSFSGDVDLSNCRFDKGLEFVGCTFNGQVSLESARVDGDCHFRACRFKDYARFDRLAVDGKLEVRAPRYKTDLKDNREGFIEKPYVVFESNVGFSQIRVSGEANFSSAQFYGEADFYNAHIGGPIFFRKDSCKAEEGERKFADNVFPVVTFGIDYDKVSVRPRARFRAVYLGGELNFHGAIFRPDADFSYLRCKGIAFFCEPFKPQVFPVCQFERGLDFEGAHFSAAVALRDAKFSPCNVVSFKDCYIADGLIFRGTMPAQLCLTGCTYKRIVCSDTQCLIAAIKTFQEPGSAVLEGCKPPPNSAKQKPEFDRSIWMQLEATLRNEGKLELADEVYIQRMRQEGRLTLNGPARIWNRMWDRFLLYGTSQKKLLFICVAFVLINALLFFAIREFGAPRSNLVTRLKDFGKAAETSLHWFSPIKLPIGDEPPHGLAAWIASLEKVMGWIMIPLLAANVAGLLHRKAPPKSESEGEE